MDLNKTPQAMRYRVNEIYGSEHRLSKIFSNLEFDSNYKHMFDYLDQHDKIRKQDWRTTFPMAVEFFKDTK
jgi:hypothetical protein